MLETVPKLAQFLVREIEIMSQIKNAVNVVNFYEHFEHQSYTVIVMEYCNGGTL